MRGKLAKMLRDAAYEGTSRSGKRLYKRAGNGMIVVIGPRRIYQAIKNEFRKAKRRGRFDV